MATAADGGEDGKKKKHRTANGTKYRNWRNGVLRRDHYKCRRCGAKKGESVKLETHHIRTYHDCPALRFSVANGITLCEACHDEVTGDEEAWQEALAKMKGQGGAAKNYCDILALKYGAGGGATDDDEKEN